MNQAFEAIMLHELLAVASGSVVGFTLGLVGSGGSILVGLYIIAKSILA
jgi:hypothetical protein